MDTDVELTPVREQHRFDEEKLRAYLQAEMDMDFGSARILQFEGGQSNPTYQIRNGDERYVLRKKPPGVLLKSAHAVDREYRVITALQNTPVPVPRTHVLCEDEAVIGTAFYVMEMVEGRVFLDTRLPTLTPRERTRIWESLIESIAALHNVDFEAVGLGDFGRPGNYYSRQIHRWGEQYRASETKPNPDMDRLMAWLPDNIPASDDSTIVHGDFRLGNCIVHPTEPRIVAILDWELSTIGHPLVDLSYWCAAEYHGDKPFPGNARDLGLPSEQEQVKQYCQLTHREGVDSWLFYVIFNLFRSAAIRQGVYKRGLDGNASSERWRDIEQAGRLAAVRGWTLVESSGWA